MSIETMGAVVVGEDRPGHPFTDAQVERTTSSR